MPVRITTGLRRCAVALSIVGGLALAGCASDVSAGDPNATDATSAAPTSPTGSGTQTTSTASPTPSASATAPDVAVVLTYASWNATAGQAEASAYAQVLATDAQCTFTLTLGSVTKSTTHPGSVSASTTQCGTLIIPAAELTAGQWTGVVTFQSAAGNGSSPTFPIDVKP